MKRFSGLLALLILATVPAMAVAHQGNSNYRSEVESISPETNTDGLTIEVVNFDDHVRMVNETGKTIIVDGYDGEPLARISEDGKVEENLNSPAYYLNQDRFADIALPDRADENAAPSWEAVGENGIYEWHDHRSHYMGDGTPPQVVDTSQRTKVFEYTIPIKIDGRPATVSGTLFWAGQNSKVPVIPFVILGLAVLAALGFWLRRRQRDDEEGSGPDGRSDSNADGGGATATG